MARSLVICSAPADRELAERIVQTIERNCPPIAIERAAIADREQFLETIERALGAEYVLAVLSPEAVPRSWSRAQWEPVLVEQPRKLQTKLALVMARECGLPQVLRKKQFFDFGKLGTAAMRQLRQWLIVEEIGRERISMLPMEVRGNADPAALAALEKDLGNQPGVAYHVSRETAAAFARAFTRDFEDTLWFDCRNRSLAGVLGDCARALHLRLTSNCAENSAALKKTARELRSLFVFDQLAAEQRDAVLFGGRASVVFTAPDSRPHKLLPLEECLALFARWRADRARCFAYLADACALFEMLKCGHGDEARARQTKDLGHFAFALLREHEHLAEAYEIALTLSQRAWEDGDATALERWEREKCWIRTSWGEPAANRLRLGSAPEPAQLQFDL